MKKGQIVPEFIIITAIVLAVMLFIFVIVVEKENESRVTQEYLAAKSVAEEIALGINQVHFGGAETKRSIWVRERVYSDVNYSAYVIPQARVVRVMWETNKGEQFFDASLMTSNINVSSNNVRINGSHLLSPGEVNITNKGGRIYIVP